MKSRIDLRSRLPKKFQDEIRPFVTLSRQTGAGGITVGRLLADYLQTHEKHPTDPNGWLVFDKNLIEEVMHEHDLSETITERVPEDLRTWMDRILDQLLGFGVSSVSLVRKISQTILHLAQMGHVILVGYGANVITRDMPGGIHARLIGSHDKRLSHIKSYYGVTDEQAEAMIKKEDLCRKDYLKENFRQNIEDPLQYDLVINTDYVSYEEAAKIIGHALVNVQKSMSMILQ